MSPEAVTLPKAVLSLYGGIIMRIGDVTDFDAVYAENYRTLYGPIVLKCAESGGTSGIGVYKEGGVCTARLRSDGIIMLAGHALINDAVPYASTANGVYFINANGDVVCAIDETGNITVPTPIARADMLSLVEPPDGLNAFSGKPLNTVLGVYPRIFIEGGEDSNVPILQILNAKEDVVLQLRHDGQMETINIVQFDVDDESGTQDIYWSF